MHSFTSWNRWTSFFLRRCYGHCKLKQVCQLKWGVFQPALQEHCWFQQDGATAHTAQISMDILAQIFPSRLISLRGDIAWSVHSPDLTPCSYFLWGYLKDYFWTPLDQKSPKEHAKPEPSNLRGSSVHTSSHTEKLLGNSECACSSALTIRATTCLTSCLKPN